MSQKKIKVKWVHSATGRAPAQKATVKALGFTRLNQVREYADSPALRGMVRKISHLVAVVD